jgi:hypothetical protein
MAKIGQNGDKHEHLDQVDMIAGRGPQAPGPIRAPPSPTCGPATSLICGITSLANEKPPFKLVWSRDKICSQWIHGPIVIHLELSTDLPTDIPAKFHHVLASQLPLGANQHHWMLRRCIQGPISAPMPPPGTPTTCSLQVPPTPLYTINRGVWCMVEVTPFILKQAFQASLSSLA